MATLFTDKEFMKILEDKVANLKNISSLFSLFELLGYKDFLFDETYQREKADFGIPSKELSQIKTIYSIFNIEKQLFGFLIETKHINRPLLRVISKYFLDTYIKPFLIFTSNFKVYHFVLPQYDKETKKVKLSTLILDTDNIFHTDLEVIYNLRITPDLTYRDIWFKWREAFNKTRVNDQFFKDFETVFFKLRDLSYKQFKDIKLAHEFTQQTLNRIIFLYFIAKKGWLAGDKRFISNFYKRYKQERNKGNQPKDSLYDKWLKVLFFEVFNKPFPNLGVFRYLPSDISQKLVMFPFLNGGLFSEEEFDSFQINLPDSIFDEIFDFLDKYNFTIREDLPLDIEVAVDPQMLGYLYESFANVAEEIYERQDLGVFYTPVVEVDFMVRRSLVEYLTNHLKGVPKEILYKFLFDENKKEAEEYFSRKDLWKELEFFIEDVRIVDPACGSGAFLVGALKVLVELNQIIDRHLGRERSDFDLKKDIIGKNLFGVDVMKWALHCAELRLWLSLIVEADIPPERRKEALLPNFNLRLRVGDSLVQKIGDITLDFKEIRLYKHLKVKLNRLKEEKSRFYRNDPGRKYKDYKEIYQEEVRLFGEILREEIIKITQSIQQEKAKLSSPGGKQLIFIKEVKEKEEQKSKLNIEKIKEKIEFLEERKKQLEKADEELHVKGKQFVIWNIDFVDAFEEKGGFDIVIGNPPYLRQEKIAPPFKPKGEVSLEEKRKYKEELIESVKAKYPFIKEMDKRCDYYVYFYFHGLSLLNDKGTFCFITSNSWLDVGYGRVLQEFLAKYVPIKAIYDNQAKRSFEHADINTVIVVFGAPDSKIIGKRNPNPSCLDNIAKFVMFKKPYEEVISSKSLINIDKFKFEKDSLFGNILKTDKYRVFVIKQEDLLKEGLEISDEKEFLKDKLNAKYIGAKWGGKFLRAPDIFFTILEKGKDKLVKLSDIAEVRFGIKTGANEFFYVEDVTDLVEDE